MYLSGEWLCVDLRMGTKRHLLKDIGLHDRNLLINLNTTRPIQSFNNSKNLHFDNLQHIHTRSENYEESGYGHDF
jgi:hypothetical protein